MSELTTLSVLEEIELTVRQVEKSKPRTTKALSLPERIERLLVLQSQEIAFLNRIINDSIRMGKPVSITDFLPENKPTND